MISDGSENDNSIPNPPWYLETCSSICYVVERALTRNCEKIIFKVNLFFVHPHEIISQSKYHQYWCIEICSKSNLKLEINLFRNQNPSNYCFFFVLNHDIRMYVRFLEGHLILRPTHCVFSTVCTEAIVTGAILALEETWFWDLSGHPSRHGPCEHPVVFSDHFLSPNFFRNGDLFLTFSVLLVVCWLYRVNCQLLFPCIIFSFPNVSSCMR